MGLKVQDRTGHDQAWSDDDLHAWRFAARVVVFMWLSLSERTMIPKFIMFLRWGYKHQAVLSATKCVCIYY